MNKEVTVTGMEVHTKVGDNLLIAQDTMANTTILADSNFKTSDIDIMTALVEPVSTVDGLNFWYTDSYNVAGNGDALSDTYKAYSEAVVASPSNALSNNLGGSIERKTNYDAAFQTNYGITGTITTDNVAYGYVDYVFQLKANNTADSAKYVNITNIALTSGKAGDADSLHAFRAAVFSEDITSGTATAAPGTLVSILSGEGATTGEYYFTDGKAISANAAPTNLSNYCSDAVIGTAAAGTTSYYKVVVRLWLEGEDEKCNNSVFNTLKDYWALSLTINMKDSNTGATNVTNVLTVSAPTTKATLTANTAISTDAANVVTIDGITYNKIGVQLDSTDIYTTDTTIASTSKIYKIVNNHPIDVTNQCILPTT